MKYREFTSITNPEIREVVTDIFHPEKVTGIRRRKDGSIVCTIHMFWHWIDADGIEDKAVLPETLVIRDPFKYGADAIECDNGTRAEDYDTYRKYCFAKGFIPWLKDNPYLR